MPEQPGMPTVRCLCSFAERHLVGRGGDSDTSQGRVGMDSPQDARLVSPDVVFPFSSQSVVLCSLAKPSGWPSGLCPVNPMHALSEGLSFLLTPPPPEFFFLCPSLHSRHGHLLG